MSSDHFLLSRFVVQPTEDPNVGNPHIWAGAGQTQQNNKPQISLGICCTPEEGLGP